jgi:hypothetical protein
LDDALFVTVLLFLLVLVISACIALQVLRDRTTPIRVFALAAGAPHFAFTLVCVGGEFAICTNSTNSIVVADVAVWLHFHVLTSFACGQAIARVDILFIAPLAFLAHAALSISHRRWCTGDVLTGAADGEGCA